MNLDLSDFNQIEDLIGDAIDQSPLMQWYTIRTQSGSEYDFRGCPIETNLDIGGGGLYEQAERVEVCTLESRHLPPTEDLVDALIFDGDDEYTVDPESRRSVGGGCYEITLKEYCNAYTNEAEERSVIDTQAPKRRRDRGSTIKPKDSGTRRQNRS